MVTRNRMRRASRQAKLRRRTRRMTPHNIMEEFGRMWDETLTKASLKK